MPVGLKPAPALAFGRQRRETMIVRGEDEIGLIRYHVPIRGVVHVDLITLADDARGKGQAVAALRLFAQRARAAKLRTLTADLTWTGARAMFQKALGAPSDEVGVELDALPDEPPELMRVSAARTAEWDLSKLKKDETLMTPELFDADFAFVLEFLDTAAETFDEAKVPDVVTAWAEKAGMKVGEAMRRYKKAGEIVSNQYPKIAKESDQWYRLKVGVFKGMMGFKPQPAAPKLATDKPADQFAKRPDSRDAKPAKKKDDDKNKGRVRVSVSVDGQKTESTQMPQSMQSPQFTHRVLATLAERQGQWLKPADVSKALGETTLAPTLCALVHMAGEGLVRFDKAKGYTVPKGADVGGLVARSAPVAEAVAARLPSLTNADESAKAEKVADYIRTKRPDADALMREFRLDRKTAEWILAKVDSLDGDRQAIERAISRAMMEALDEAAKLHVGDLVMIDKGVQGGGQKGRVSQVAPSGKFFGVKTLGGKFIGYYHESDLTEVDDDDDEEERSDSATFNLDGKKWSLELDDEEVTAVLDDGEDETEYTITLGGSGLKVVDANGIRVRADRLPKKMQDAAYDMLDRSADESLVEADWIPKKGDRVQMQLASGPALRGRVTAVRESSQWPSITVAWDDGKKGTYDVRKLEPEESVDEASGVTTEKLFTKGYEQMWLVSKDGLVHGYVTKIKNTRTDQHPWKAYRYQKPMAKDAINARDAEGAVMLGVTFDGGLKVAAQAVANNTKLSEGEYVDDGQRWFVSVSFPEATEHVRRQATAKLDDIADHWGGEQGGSATTIGTKRWGVNYDFTSPSSARTFANRVSRDLWFRKAKAEVSWDEDENTYWNSDESVDESGEYGVRWQEWGKGDRLVTKERFFKTEKALEAFVAKLHAKDDLHDILARSYPEKTDAPSESLLPSTVAAYERVIAEGGVSTAALPTVFGTSPFAETGPDGEVLDPNGVPWYPTPGDSGTFERWIPVIEGEDESLDENSVTIGADADMENVHGDKVPPGTYTVRRGVGNQSIIKGTNGKGYVVAHDELEARVSRTEAKAPLPKGKGAKGGVWRTLQSGHRVLISNGKIVGGNPHLLKAIGAGAKSRKDESVDESEAEAVSKFGYTDDAKLTRTLGKRCKDCAWGAGQDVGDGKTRCLLFQFDAAKEGSCRAFEKYNPGVRVKAADRAKRKREVLALGEEAAQEVAALLQPYLCEGAAEPEVEAVEVFRLMVRPRQLDNGGGPYAVGFGSYETYCFYDDGQVVRDRYADGRNTRTRVADVPKDQVEAILMSVAKLSRKYAGAGSKTAELSVVVSEGLDEAAGTKKVYTVLWSDPNNPNGGPAGDGSFTSRFKSEAAAKAFARGKPGPYGEAAATVDVDDVPLKLWRRWNSEGMIESLDEAEIVYFVWGPNPDDGETDELIGAFYDQKKAHALKREFDADDSRMSFPLVKARITKASGGTRYNGLIRIARTSPGIRHDLGEGVLDEDPIVALGALGSLAVAGGLSAVAIKALRAIKAFLAQGKKSAAEQAWEKLSGADQKALRALLAKRESVDESAFDWMTPAFLKAIGFNPDGTPIPRKTYECGTCHAANAYYRELHADTGMDEVVLWCPDCRSETAKADEGSGPLGKTPDAPRPTNKGRDGAIKDTHGRETMDERMVSVSIPVSKQSAFAEATRALGLTDATKVSRVGDAYTIELPSAKAAALSARLGLDEEPQGSALETVTIKKGQLKRLAEVSRELGLPGDLPIQQEPDRQSFTVQLAPAMAAKVREALDLAHAN